MKKIALVTSEELNGLTQDDQILFRELRSRNLDVVPAVWDDPKINWHDFALVIIRSTWDYVGKIDKFMTWLDFLEENEIKVWNSVEIIRNNINKIYLKKLEEHGIFIIPSFWIDKGNNTDLTKILRKNNWQKAVIKPSISATAYNTFLVSPETLQAGQEALNKILNESGAIIQKFIGEISEKGEWAFIFFKGKYSHAVLKKTAANDFRVQEKYGGSTETGTPPAYLVETAGNIIKIAAADCLYARVDGIEVSGEFLLMELELTEPSLFFENVPEAACLLADEIIILLSQ
jgi:glutathione synthase/RimK-type ligase-like ATP-grasp enzyme